MTRTRTPAHAGVDRWLTGLSPIEAARAIARPSREIDSALAQLDVDRARLVIDVYESRAATRPNRKAHGIYYTPPWVVEAMLDRVPLDGLLLDPAAGAGAFVVALSRRLGLEELQRIHACDLDQEALDVCALALEAAWGAGALELIAGWRTNNAHAGDYLHARPTAARPNLVIGNPPYGVSAAAELGELPSEGERDLSLRFLLRALTDIAPGGQVALLVPDTWLTNHRAKTLRRTLLERTGLARVVDFGKPFQTAKDTRVHAVVLQQSASECRVESLRDGVVVPMASARKNELASHVRRGWFLYRTTEEARACAALERHASPLGEKFGVLYGLRTGNNPRFVQSGTGAVPLIGGLDFDAFDRHVAPRHLAQPETFARLVAAQRGRWKVGIQRIRTNSRLPWRRWLEGALLSPGEVGLDSLTLIAHDASGEALSDELCALLGVVNSSILNRWYRLAFTDVNVKPVYVRELPVPALSPELARLVRRRLGRPGDRALERAIDRLVAEAYQLGESGIGVFERGFWTEELERRPLPTLDAALALAREGDDALGVASG